jgi:hypothetical protein
VKGGRGIVAPRTLRGRRRLPEIAAAATRLLAGFQLPVAFGMPLTRKEIAMSRQVILGLAAATLVGITLVPDNALAHYGGRLHAVRVCDAADYRGWNPFSRDAGLRGYPGPHYGCDCYRAANRRATCRFY